MSLKALTAVVVLVYIILFLCGETSGLSSHQCTSECVQGCPSLRAAIGGAIYRFGEYFAPVMGGVLTLAGVALTIRHQRKERDWADGRQMRLIEKNHRLAVRPAIKLSIEPLCDDICPSASIRLCDSVADGEVRSTYRVEIELLNANHADQVEVSIVGSALSTRSVVASFGVLARQFEKCSKVVAFCLPLEGLASSYFYCVVSFYDAEGNYYQKPYSLHVSRSDIEGDTTLCVSLGSEGRVRYIERVARDGLYVKIKAHFEAMQALEERERSEQEMLANMEGQVPGCLKLLDLACERHYADTGASFDEYLLKCGLDRGLSPAGAGFSGYSDVFADPQRHKLYATLSHSVDFSDDDSFSFKSVCWGHTVEIDVRTGRSVLIARRIVSDEISDNPKKAKEVKRKYISSGKRPFAPLAAWRYWVAR